MEKRKISWNENSLKNTTDFVDLEKNKGIFLNVAHTLIEKKIRKPKGYNDFLKKYNLTNAPQNEVLNAFENVGLFDFYLYNIFSTDKYYKDDYVELLTMESVLVIYLVNDKKYIKIYYNMYDKEKNQVGFTQTLHVEELQDNVKGYIFNTDLHLPEIKGNIEKNISLLFSSLVELKGLSKEEKEQKLIEKSNLLKERQNEKDIVISLHSQGIKQFEKEWKEKQEQKKKEMIEKEKEKQETEKENQ